MEHKVPFKNDWKRFFYKTVNICPTTNSALEEEMQSSKEKKISKNFKLHKMIGGIPQKLKGKIKNKNKQGKEKHPHAPPKQWQI